MILSLFRCPTAVIYYLYECMHVCMYVCMCVSKLSTLNKNCVCDCSSCIYQEEQLLAAASGGRVDEVASLLDQGVDIQCKDSVINERID